jgi:hypothetical protein
MPGFALKAARVPQGGGMAALFGGWEAHRASGGRPVALGVSPNPAWTYHGPRFYPHCPGLDFATILGLAIGDPVDPPTRPPRGGDPLDRGGRGCRSSGALPRRATDVDGDPAVRARVG